MANRRSGARPTSGKGAAGASAKPESAPFEEPTSPGWLSQGLKRPAEPETSSSDRAADRAATKGAKVTKAARDAKVAKEAKPKAERTSTTRTRTPAAAPNEGAAASRTRTARLRLVHVDPWSVMKTAFLLSIALGIIMIVAVTIVWGVLGAAGVWDSINSSVQKTVGSDTSTPFDITDYIGAGRVIGFTMVASVIDVVVLTALATLGAFVYNLAATLLGGVEMTFAEDR